MKARAIAVAALGGVLLIGCASIVGISDLSPDGGSGTGSGSGSSSGASSGSGSGSSSGVSSGSGSGSSSGASSGSGSGSSSGASSGSGSGSSSGAGSCTVPTGAVCAVDPQCGCSAGQKCDIGASVAGCTSAGTSPSGTICTLNTDCAAGLTCAGGVCRPYCTAAQVGGACPAATSGPTLGACFQDADSTGTAIPQDSLCLFQCTPDPSNCSTGQGCVLLRNATGTIAYTDCELSGAGKPGSTCTTDQDCAAGSMCYEPSGSATAVCAQFCRTTTDCANLSNTTCDTTTISFTIRGVTYGFCD